MCEVSATVFSLEFYGRKKDFTYTEYIFLSLLTFELAAVECEQ